MCWEKDEEDKIVIMMIVFQLRPIKVNQNRNRIARAKTELFFPREKRNQIVFGVDFYGEFIAIIWIPFEQY